MLTPAAKIRPYADAPRLPEGERIDPRSLVGAGTSPIELELGPGRGGFLFERLASDPSARMIGLEIRRKWATLVDRRLADRGYGARARVFAEDAREALPRFPDACTRAVFIHFPDPWWKKRHQKRLLVGDGLASEITRVLQPGGELFVQTDVEERAERYEALFATCPALVPAAGAARIAVNPFGAMSPRERRAVSDGLPIYRLHYRRLEP